MNTLQKKKKISCYFLSIFSSYQEKQKYVQVHFVLPEGEKDIYKALLLTAIKLERCTKTLTSGNHFSQQPNHSITEQFGLEGTFKHHLCHPLHQAAQRPLQSGLVHFQGQSTHSFSEQHVPTSHLPPGKRFLLCVQSQPIHFQLKNIAPCPLNNRYIKSLSTAFLFTLLID